MSVFENGGLPIEDKEDHPQRLAELEGVLSKYYYTAEEINVLKRAIVENFTNKLPKGGYEGTAADLKAEIQATVSGVFGPITPATAATFTIDGFATAAENGDYVFAPGTPDEVTITVTEADRTNAVVKINKKGTVYTKEIIPLGFEPQENPVAPTENALETEPAGAKQTWDLVQASMLPLIPAKNIYDHTKTLQDRYVKASDGVVYNLAGWQYSGFCSIKPNTQYFIVRRTGPDYRGVTPVINFAVNSSFKKAQTGTTAEKAHVAAVNNGDNTFTSPADPDYKWFEFSLNGGLMDADDKMMLLEGSPEDYDFSYYIPFREKTDPESIYTEDAGARTEIAHVKKVLAGNKPFDGLKALCVGDSMTVQEGYFNKLKETTGISTITKRATSGYKIKDAYQDVTQSDVDAVDVILFFIGTNN